MPPLELHLRAVPCWAGNCSTVSLNPGTSIRPPQPLTGHIRRRARCHAPRGRLPLRRLNFSPERNMSFDFSSFTESV
jgi:hypothetical protein